MKILNRTLFYLSAVVFAIALIMAGIYITIPTHNTAATHFDTLIVLGYPANSDGTPSPEQRERVLIEKDRIIVDASRGEQRR